MDERASELDFGLVAVIGKFKVFSAVHTIAMVTYYLATECSAVIEQFLIQ